MKHLLSFDLEEWFHTFSNDAVDEWDGFAPRIEIMTDRLLGFLKARNARATFFVLGWVAEKYPHLIARLVREGHEVGCHSHLHRPVWSMAPDEFAHDLRLSLAAIAAAGGTRPRIFRAPGFSIDARALWAFDILAGEGIELDSSVYPGRHSYGGIPTAPLTPFVVKTSSGALIREFPVSTCSILGQRMTFSGGGYFRLLPLALQKNRFRAFDQAGDPVITYFHPRDFDQQIPKSDFGWLREFKNNLNVSGALGKLSVLMGEFEMSTLSEVDRSVNWGQKPTYEPAALL